MPSSLVLRLAGPLQSWGTSPFKQRTTSEVPTRSGVLGLLGAALGAPRGELPAWFEGLQVAVRVDRQGVPHHDYHTVNPPTREVAARRGRLAFIEGAAKRPTPIGHVVRLANDCPSPQTEVTHRYYLADAAFLVAIGHRDSQRVRELEAAARKPKFMTYLGRKACPPTFPFLVGIHQEAPLEALESVESFDADPGTTVRRYVALPGDRHRAEGAVKIPGGAS